MILKETGNCLANALIAFRNNILSLSHENLNYFRADLKHLVYLSGRYCGTNSLVNILNIKGWNNAMGYLKTDTSKGMDA